HEQEYRDQADVLQAAQSRDAERRLLVQPVGEVRRPLHQWSKWKCTLATPSQVSELTLSALRRSMKPASLRIPSSVSRISSSLGRRSGNSSGSPWYDRRRSRLNSSKLACKVSGPLLQPCSVAASTSWLAANTARATTSGRAPQRPPWVRRKSSICFA